MRRVWVATFGGLLICGCTSVTGAFGWSFGEDGGAERDGGPDAGPPTCPMLSAPEQGSVDRTSGVAAIATYTCNTGYVLTGNGGANTRTCQADGTWTGSDPACEPVVTPCGPNPCTNGGTCTEQGETFSCTCDPTSGFTGATCDTPVECAALTPPVDGSIDRTTTGMVGDVATYSCDSLYYPVGERTRTCQPDGAWSGSAPSCRATGGYPVWPMPGTPAHLFEYDVRTDTVLDQVTGLEWQRNVDSSVHDWEQAQSYCATLELDGKSNWRLPTRIELVSIVDYSAADPAIDASVFPATPSNQFWTSSPSVVATGQAWTVNFNYGFVGYTDEIYALPVRCVR